MLTEIENLKMEKDRKLLEYQTNLSREKDMHRQREEELENKLKDAENAKSNQLFEFEKYKAQWTIEKDRLQIDLDELREQNIKLKKRKEKLTAENEKLKNDFRAHRQIMTKSYLKSSQIASQMASSDIEKVQSRASKPSSIASSKYSLSEKYTQLRK